MTKILWFSNHVFRDCPDKATGTWLGAMGRALAESGEFELVNVSHGKVRSPQKADCDKVSQWLVPVGSVGVDGLPSKKIVDGIAEIVSAEHPDLIHVWGTENYWGLLTARKMLPQPALLDMQGIKYAIAPHMMGGLSVKEAFECVGIKELLRPSCSFFCQQWKFKKARKYESEIIKGHKFIAFQSEWVRAHVESLNATGSLFPTRMMLRRNFVESQPWVAKNFGTSPVIFTSNSDPTPYKGLHVLLRAVAILRETYPDICLKIGGAQIQRGIRKCGYIRWLIREIRRLGLQGNVIFLGALDAQEMVAQFYSSSVVVIPSFIESYSLALAEAMAVGVPLVVSYAGGMPELASPDKTALFFSPGDEVMCAYQIQRFLISPILSVQLSKAAREIGLRRNDSREVLDRQIEIYREVITRY